MEIGATLGPAPAPDTNQGGSSKKIADAAKQFESILINQMLESARASSQDDDGQDSAVSGYAQQQFAQALAERGGLGIAKMVVVGLEKHAN
jgi:Rod binding domain-containing protein